MELFVIEPTMQFMIPFLFVLAIVLGVLELSLKDWSKPVKVVLSVAIAFFATSYQPFVSALWSYLPNITWFFIIMFFIAFIMELFGIRKAGTRASPESMMIQGAILFILLATGYMIIQEFPGVQVPFIGGPENLLLLVGIFFVLAIFWTAFKIGSGVQAKE